MIVAPPRTKSKEENIMEIKFTARTEYPTGSMGDCVSFPSEAAVDAWANSQLRQNPGATVIVRYAYSAEVFRTYGGR